MQTANVMVAIGGDAGHTVPKYGVTAAEIAVLRSIHGDEAVFDIEPVGEVKVSHRDERTRLKLLYGRAMDGDNRSIVEGLYPGAAARLFDTIDELELDDSLFKVRPAEPAKPAKGKKAKAAEAAPEPPAEEGDNDGIEEMNDGVLE